MCLTNGLPKWSPNTVEDYCAILRYADDCMAVFEFEDDAQRFMRVLPKRVEKFGLRLNQTKTQLLAFGKRQAWQSFKDGKKAFCL